MPTDREISIADLTDLRDAILECIPHLDAIQTLSREPESQFSFCPPWLEARRCLNALAEFVRKYAGPKDDEEQGDGDEDSVKFHKVIPAVRSACIDSNIVSFGGVAGTTAFEVAFALVELYLDTAMECVADIDDASPGYDPDELPPDVDEAQQAQDCINRLEAFFQTGEVPEAANEPNNAAVSLSEPHLVEGEAGDVDFVNPDCSTEFGVYTHDPFTRIKLRSEENLFWQLFSLEVRKFELVRTGELFAAVHKEFQRTEHWLKYECPALDSTPIAPFGTDGISVEFETLRAPKGPVRIKKEGVTQIDEEDNIPFDFREQGWDKGQNKPFPKKALFADYLYFHPDWKLSNSDLAKAVKAKTITRRLKLKNKYVYEYRECDALRERRKKNKGRQRKNQRNRDEIRKQEVESGQWQRAQRKIQEG